MEEREKRSDKEGTKNTKYINKKELVHNKREEKNECIIELKREN